MNLNKKEFKIEFAGQPLKLEVSKIAEQANAAVIGQYGDTSVLVTVTIGKEDRSIDYFPLVIDYEEKFYAAGKIIGSRFIRREGRPSEEAILSGRLIDRSLRPFFDQRLRRDVQIIIIVLSYDEENDPDFIALLTASTALGISEIPWGGPVAGLRLARLEDGRNAINLRNSEIKDSKNIRFELFIASVNQKIDMIELAGGEAKEEEIIESFIFAQRSLEELIKFQDSIIKDLGKPKIKYEHKDDSDGILKKEVAAFLGDKLDEAVYVGDKSDRQSNLGNLKEELKEALAGKDIAFSSSQVDLLVDEEVGKLVRKNIIESEKRPDGRRLDEIRDLYAEVGLFKRLHGSALFVRGNTQSLAVVTLAAPGAEQLIETMEISEKRRFMLHYNFPPYSVGEIGRLVGPGRREIGHGALAEKSIRSLIPSKEEFPYTIRVVSEILSSNGSSSMATVCASSLALMDAGVPLKKAVAGIAMGLILKNENNYKILTDLQGPEDHHGDMDLKVAGTEDGITAIQMDVKTDGLTIQVLKEALIQAQKARLEILEFMNKVIEKPRPQVSSYAPVIMTMDIKPDQIGGVIGPGGKIINSIIGMSGASSIDIEQTGKVFVAAVDSKKASAAIAQIKALTRDFQVGDIVEGEVIKILDFGAIVDLSGGKDGMIHVSELKDGFVQKVEDVLRVGDTVRAKVIRSENGKIGLSLRALANKNKETK